MERKREFHMDATSVLTAQTALSRQAITLSVIRQNADASQQMADMLDASLRSAPVSGSRGANVDIQA